MVDAPFSDGIPCITVIRYVACSRNKRSTSGISTPEIVGKLVQNRADIEATYSRCLLMADAIAAPTDNTTLGLKHQNAADLGLETRLMY